MRYGTSHFVSKDSAMRYYAYENPSASYSERRNAIERRLAEGAIHIGEPTLKPGERLLVIDDGTRYAIAEVL
jgi:hypothetical protein